MVDPSHFHLRHRMHSQMADHRVPKLGAADASPRTEIMANAPGTQRPGSHREKRGEVSACKLLKSGHDVVGSADWLAVSGVFEPIRPIRLQFRDLRPVLHNCRPTDDASGPVSGQVRKFHHDARPAGLETTRENAIMPHLPQTHPLGGRSPRTVLLEAMQDGGLGRLVVRGISHPRPGGRH